MTEYLTAAQHKDLVARIRASKTPITPTEKEIVAEYQAKLRQQREEFLRVATPILAAAVAGSMFPDPGRDVVATAASWATHLIELADKKFSL